MTPDFMATDGAPSIRKGVWDVPLRQSQCVTNIHGCEAVMQLVTEMVNTITAQN